MDGSITHWINSFSGQFASLDWSMVAVTKGGPYVMVGLIALRWFVKVNRVEERHLAIQCGIATVLGLILNQLVLLKFHRARPYDIGFTHLIVEKSGDPSFPSDHATVAFAIGALLTLRRDKWVMLSIMSAILIGVSRVFVGTHYLGDILGGAVMGLLGAAFTLVGYGHLDRITARLVKVL